MRDFKDLKIAVAGTGYVGLSIATLLSQHHKVMAVDIVPEKVELINNKKSPIQDEYIEKYLAEKELNLTATLDAKEAYSDADFVVIATPTNYDSKKNFFDTSAVEAVIKLVIEYNPEAIMVIKSRLNQVLNAIDHFYTVSGSSALGKILCTAGRGRFSDSSSELPECVQRKACTQRYADDSPEAAGRKAAKYIYWSFLWCWRCDRMG